MDSVAPLRKKSRPGLLINNGNAPHHPRYMDHLLPLDRIPAALDNLPSERESFSTGVGSKSKACLKFFSTSGCPYGESCHFSHYVPGGLSSFALSQTASDVGARVLKGKTGPTGLSSSRASSEGHTTQLCKNFGTPEGCRFGEKCYFAHGEKENRKFKDSMLATDRALDRLSSLLPHLNQGFSSEGFKTRLCTNFQSPEGCRFGEKCHFAHGEMDLRKSNGSMGAADATLDEKRLLRSLREPTPPGLGAAASFGAVSTAKVSINASLAGLIIGKGGVNAKSICRVTGAKLFVKDHESDSNLRNIEMEGSFDQIQQASAMVRELLVHVDAAPIKPRGVGSPNYKTKLCENFSKGSCTYGDRCHFAHSSDELRAATTH